MPSPISAQTPMPTVSIGVARLDFQNVQLREDVLLDEVHLEGGDIRLEPPVGDEAPRVRTGETRFRAMISEPNLNRMLTANTPPDVPVKNLKATLLSGKIRFSCQFIKLVTIPLALEAIPRIENGVRVSLDWQDVKLGFAMLPSMIVEILEKYGSKTLDLSHSPIPVWLEEIRCEPGRLTVLGKARVIWPPVSEAIPAPFTAREQPIEAETQILLPAPTESSEEKFLTP